MTIRNAITTVIRSAKKQHIPRKIDTLQSNSNPRDWWKTVKTIMESQIQSDFPPLVSNNQTITDDYEKAHTFNNIFCEQSTIVDGASLLPTLYYLTEKKLDWIQTTELDVNDVLTNITTSKATGTDQIHPRLLKEATPTLSKPLSKLFNLSLEIGYFPDKWKEAFPVHHQNTVNLK
jgi:hypothetical protein